MGGGAHGPGQKRLRADRTVPAAWWANIQDILDNVRPVRDTDGRWVYVDTVRRRRLVIDRDALGRMVVISYYPRRVRT